MALLDVLASKPRRAIGLVLQVVATVGVAPLAITLGCHASTMRVRLFAWQRFAAIMMNSSCAPYLFYIFQMPS